MPNFRRKIVAAATTAAAVTGLGLAATPADAATASVQVKVCNKDSQPGWVIKSAYVDGNNQNGTHSTSYTFNVNSNACVTVNNWWWGVGQTANVFYQSDKGVNYVYPFQIPSSAKNGSTFTVNVNNHGGF